MSDEQAFMDYLSIHNKIPNFERISEWERHKPSFALPMVRTLFLQTVNFNFGSGKDRKMLVIDHEKIKELFDLKVPNYISIKIFNTKRPIASISFIFEDTYNKSGCSTEFLLNSPKKILSLYGFARREISKSLWSLIWLVKMFNNTSISILNQIKSEKPKSKKTTVKSSDDDELGEIKSALKQLTLTVQLLANSVVGDEK